MYSRDCFSGGNCAPLCDGGRSYQPLLKDSLRLAITSRRLTPEEMGSFNSREVLSARDKDCDGWACVNNESGQSGHIDWSERSSPYSYRGSRTVERYLSLIPFGDIHLVFDNKNSSTVRFAVDSIAKERRFRLG